MCSCLWAAPIWRGLLLARRCWCLPGIASRPDSRRNAGYRSYRSLRNNPVAPRCPLCPLGGAGRRLFGRTKVPTFRQSLSNSEAVEAALRKRNSVTFITARRQRGSYGHSADRDVALPIFAGGNYAQVLYGL